MKTEGRATGARPDSILYKLAMASAARVTAVAAAARVTAGEVTSAAEMPAAGRVPTAIEVAATAEVLSTGKMLRTSAGESTEGAGRALVESAREGFVAAVSAVVGHGAWRRLVKIAHG